MAGTRNLVKNLWLKDEQRYIQEHVLIAERALGKKLPSGAEVHHVDLDPTNNHSSNLVICPNHAYHMMLHARQRAMDACGNPNHKLCQICGKHDDPSNLNFNKKRRLVWHKAGLGCKKIKKADR